MPTAPHENANYHSQISEINTSEQNDETIFNAKETKPEESEDTKRAKKILKRKKRSNGLDIRQSLLNLRDHILNKSITEFACTKKKAKMATKNNLERRSQYIGVSRNNSNWQALINVNRVKKYIGTFSNEIQAARAYDLHSAAVRGEEASLNFSYTPQEMLETIEHFLTHNSIKYGS
mmetsp:Transcript_31038/g.30587  ORF Transcript_31038/g.30587 Transcript_31038/m.30587 type:complete len:177 (-) Transcript_31038:24-554(-)|eukprot:CAMPEP_0197009566 /NCGR_PEP_ID=MMETSP1380-20130617/50671_1 /TAXON_ID=5936 /ORGANISM="Euplotes crassus, Strain CT5" /LENGTH=176 /DNA_ID=CAMNT_0042430909 /DNA_START=109 /DNA_END=639 /DNA_ORIENTATION=-